MAFPPFRLQQLLRVLCTRSRVEMAGVTMHALISCTRTMRVLLHPALSTLQLRVENVRVLAKRHV